VWYLNRGGKVGGNVSKMEKKSVYEIYEE